MTGLTPDAVASVVGGLVAMILMWCLRWLAPPIRDRIALWAAYFVSLLVAVFVYIVTGGQPTPEKLIIEGGSILGYATLIWRQFLKAQAGESPLVNQKPEGP